MFIFTYLLKPKKAVGSLPERVGGVQFLKNVFLSVLLLVVIGIGPYIWVSNIDEVVAEKMTMIFYVVLGYLVSSLLIKAFVFNVAGVKVPFYEIVFFHFCTSFFTALFVLLVKPSGYYYDEGLPYFFLLLPSFLYVSVAISTRYAIAGIKSHLIVLLSFLITIIILAFLV